MTLSGTERKIIQNPLCGLLRFNANMLFLQYIIQGFSRVFPLFTMYNSPVSFGASLVRFHLISTISHRLDESFYLPLSFHFHFDSSFD